MCLKLCLILPMSEPMKPSFNLLRSNYFVRIPNAVTLSISKRVRYWGYPSSIKAISIGVLIQVLTCTAAISISKVVLMTFLNTLALLNMRNRAPMGINMQVRTFNKSA